PSTSECSAGGPPARAVSRSTARTSNPRTNGGRPGHRRESGTGEGRCFVGRLFFQFTRFDGGGDRTMRVRGRGLLWLLGVAAGVLAGLAAPAPATAAYLNGVDVSHYQGTINWASVRGAGITFAFAKATEGTTYTDPTVNTNIAGMKANGIVPGAYHFGH